MISPPAFLPPVSRLSCIFPWLRWHAGMLVRSGEGGRGTPFSYTSTAKGRGGVADALRKLAEDAELIRRGKSAAEAVQAGGGGGGAAQAAPAGGGGEGPGEQREQAAAAGAEGASA